MRIDNMKNIVSNIKKFFFSLSVLCLAAGCEREPKNDLEKWVNENSIEPFQQVTLSRGGLQINLVENGLLKANLPTIQKPDKTIDKYISDYIEWNLNFERRVGAGKLQMVSIDKFAPDIAKKIHDAMQAIKPNNKGSSYLIFNSIPCIGSTPLTEWTIRRNEILDKNNLAKRFQSEVLNNGQREKIIEQFDEWYLELRMESARRRPATCNQSLSPAYRISVLYIVGQTGIWVPEFFFDYINETDNNSVGTCGFDADKVAAPTWVRQACIEKQLFSRETNIGLTQSMDKTWIFSVSALNPLLVQMPWQELLMGRSRELIWTVNLVEERK